MASTASGRQIRSSSANSAGFASSSSTIASITRSQPARSPSSVVTRSRATAASRSSCGALSLLDLPGQEVIDPLARLVTELRRHLAADRRRSPPRSRAARCRRPWHRARPPRSSAPPSRRRILPSRYAAICCELARREAAAAPTSVRVVTRKGVANRIDPSATADRGDHVAVCSRRSGTVRPATAVPRAPASRSSRSASSVWEREPDRDRVARARSRGRERWPAAGRSSPGGAGARSTSSIRESAPQSSASRPTATMKMMTAISMDTCACDRYH